MRRVTIGNFGTRKWGSGLREIDFTMMMIMMMMIMMGFVLVYTFANPFKNMRLSSPPPSPGIFIWATPVFFWASTSSRAFACRVLRTIFV
jgi:hypothetical protein